jgi:hypothetical protein
VFGIKKVDVFAILGYTEFRKTIGDCLMAGMTVS